MWHLHGNRQAAYTRKDVFHIIKVLIFMSLESKRADFAALVSRFVGWRDLSLSELLSWINNDSAVARMLTTDPDRPVKPRTVAAWRFKERVPNPQSAAVLYVLSDGSLTPDKIYSEKIAQIINKRDWH